MKRLKVKSLIPSLGLQGRPIGTIIELPEDVALRKVEQGKAELVQEKANEPDEQNELQNLSQNKLRKLAKEKGIEGYSTKEKEELIELLGGE